MHKGSNERTSRNCFYKVPQLSCNHWGTCWSKTVFGSVFASSKVMRSAMLGIDLSSYLNMVVKRQDSFFFRLVIMIFVPFLFRSRSLTLKRAWILGSSCDISRGKEWWNFNRWEWVNYHDSIKEHYRWRNRNTMRNKRTFSFMSNIVRNTAHFHCANHYPNGRLFISADRIQINGNATLNIIREHSLAILTHFINT